MGGMSFLNKKPWHPSTFRNEETKWLKEQRAAQVVKTEAEKADLVARETEQRELAALAARARGEQPSRESSAVGFLYAAPPGLKQAQEKLQAVAAGGAASAPDGDTQAGEDEAAARFRRTLLERKKRDPSFSASAATKRNLSKSGMASSRCARRKSSSNAAKTAPARAGAARSVNTIKAPSTQSSGAVFPSKRTPPFPPDAKAPLPPSRKARTKAAPSSSTKAFSAFRASVA